MKTRFDKKAKIFDIVITAVGGTLSVGVMLYAVFHFGLSEAWPEMVLNMFYIACLVMIWMYFFNYRLTHQQFNYWCSVSLGATVLLRDILFPPPLAFYALHLSCLTLSVLIIISSSEMIWLSAIRGKSMAVKAIIICRTFVADTDKLQLGLFFYKDKNNP